MRMGWKASSWPGMAERFWRDRANSVKALARDSGDLRSALTEFAPALRCHQPGQAGFLKADSETRAVLVLPARGYFLLRCNRLLTVDLGHVRALS